ncbi:MAG: hypothetical protein K2Q01_03265, partial [Rickettsiales bacterium]|nr:hypothetical protein [Rickettsiales bacterium]
MPVFIDQPIAQRRQPARGRAKLIFKCPTAKVAVNLFGITVKLGGIPKRFDIERKILVSRPSVILEP